MMEKSKPKHTNSLIHESSPYLLQHAHNPVEWFAWNNETLARAKSENKLILISIGYSACHWCHVMEHESFENEEVAKIMNENFICIKVDREERPDVDQIYMDAVQMISGRGGWPLNCFALSDGRPIWGGTYFQTEQWIGILNNLIQLYDTQKEKLIKQAESLTEGIKKNNFIDLEADESGFTKELPEDMVHNFSTKFDHTEGGTKGAPKFPMPNNYLFLLRYYARTKKPEILKQVELTLEKMASGGIYDQIGGGFSRYAVDDHWHVPHFEKMLYDNAQLISLYSEAYQLTKNETYKQIVEETIDFINRELTNPKGGFYSALDADSEGVEGKFYVWKKEEVESIITEDFEIVNDYFGIDGDAYWEDGNNVLVKAMSVSDLSKKYKKTDRDISRIISLAKKVILEKRSTRIPPGLDDKTLTSWNALMIKGYVDASVAIGNSDYLITAISSADFLFNKVRTPNGGLYHNYKNGKATIIGFLEDYAFLIEALIALYQATFDEKWIVEARQLIDFTIEHFYDNQTGMFYFTSNESNDLVARKIEVTDNVIPASNSSIAKSLFDLSLIFENSNYKQIAEGMLKRVEDKLISFPTAFSNWGIFYLNLVYPFYTVVISGKDAQSMSDSLTTSYLPNIIKAGSARTSGLSIFNDRFVDDKTMVYVCTGNECKLPVDTVIETLKQIELKINIQ